MKFSTSLLSFTLFVILFCQCKPAPPPFGVEFVDVAKAKEIIEQNDDIVILDVRTPEEVAEGALENAINIDVKDESFSAEVSKLSTKETYLVYCRSGSRSRKAVDQMSELGFDRVYMMDGGYLDWTDYNK